MAVAQSLANASAKNTMKRVMVFGTFDVLHPGHIHFLKRARKLGDYLIVSIARGSNAKKIKGRRTRHTESERKQMLESLHFVDKVIIGAKRDYIAHIAKEKPDVIALGYDQKHYTAGLREKLAVRGLSVKIVRVDSYKPRLYKSKKYKIF